MKNTIYAQIVILALALGLISGCAGSKNYGTLSPQTDQNGRVSVADLEANQGDYNIHYATWQSKTPAAMMFDPKDNGTTLTGESWTKAEDAAAISELVKTVTRQYSYTKVLEIIGPDKQVLGYMITPTRDLFIKAGDDNTFYVSSLRRPPSVP